MTKISAYCKKKQEKLSKRIRHSLIYGNTDDIASAYHILTQSSWLRVQNLTCRCSLLIESCVQPPVRQRL